MRQSPVLIISAGANVALLALLLVSRHHGATAPATEDTNTYGPRLTNPPAPKFVVRKQFFSWQEVESTDYPTYIQNLRDIGCPEQTIRDIIVADVDELYARKRMTEIVTADQQWWRADPDPSLNQVAVDRLQALERERRALLTTLLGPDWETAGPNVPPRPGVVLNGPVLGALSPESKQAVLDISSKSQQRIAAYLSAQRQAGQPIDPAQLANLRQQTRNELAAILTPLQLEEYLLRYSQSSAQLRRDLRGFDVTPDEFRAIFRAVDQIDQQIAVNYSGDTPTSAAQRAAMEARRTQAIRDVLGQDRYEQLQEVRDSAYRDAVALGAKAGASPDQVQSLYSINQALAQEVQRIQNDPSLTADQKAQQIKAAQDQQVAASDVVLGLTPPAPPAAPSQPPTPPMGTHTYFRGETIDAIANNYGISPDALRAANPNVDFSRLNDGVQIKIPQPQTH